MKGYMVKTMKCQKCGKNEVNFHYTSNVNGAVTEAHLCADCARESGYMQNSMFGARPLMDAGSLFGFGDTFGDTFGTSGLGAIGDAFGMPVIPRAALRPFSMTRSPAAWIASPFYALGLMYPYLAQDEPAETPQTAQAAQTAQEGCCSDSSCETHAQDSSCCGAAGSKAEPETSAQSNSATEKNGIDSEMSARREINALREQMRSAAAADDFEKAMLLRDRIRDMEASDGN